MRELAIRLTVRGWQRGKFVGFGLHALVVGDPDTVLREQLPKPPRCIDHKWLTGRVEFAALPLEPIADRPGAWQLRLIVR